MNEDLPDHAENSPSSSEAWSTCADYINANRGLPDETSWQAAEGTMAHTISEECLQNGQDAADFIGQTFTVGQFSFTWTEDDAMLLQHGIDETRATPGKFFGEHRVDLTEWLGYDTLGRPQGGTLDRGILSPDCVVISDLKWGRGVPVRPHANKQLQLYALGFGREHGITDPATPFVLRIDQPRNMSGGGEWRTTWGELLEFGTWIRERADATRAPNPPRTASNSACMWCRRKIAKGSCATFETYIMDLLGMELEDLDPPAVLTLPEGLTPARRRTLIEHSKMITTWLDQMEEAALADALAGADAGGLKPVYGRKSPDAWLDGKAAEVVVGGILGARTFNQRLITPTQCAKQIPEDSFDRLLIEPLIKRGERKPVLAPPEDERPPIVTAKQIAELDDL
jgi:hypothetical protein